jgi:hypothetical protein
VTSTFGAEMVPVTDEPVTVPVFVDTIPNTGSVETTEKAPLADIDPTQGTTCVRSTVPVQLAKSPLGKFRTTVHISLVAVLVEVHT